MIEDRSLVRGLAFAVAFVGGAVAVELGYVLAGLVVVCLAVALLAAWITGV